MANGIVSLPHVASTVATLVGETCTSYIVGRLVEVLPLVAIARVAGTWGAPAAAWLPARPRTDGRASRAHRWG